jgi:gluconokinase
MEYVLGLDIGSSSVRGLLYDERGRRRRAIGAQVFYLAESGHDGSSTLDPALLLQATQSVLDAVNSQCVAARISVRAVGVSSFWHGLAAVDQDFAPLTPVVLWSDTRPTGQAIALQKELGTACQEFHQRTGCPIHSSFWPSKLRWLAREAPDVYARSRMFISFVDLLFHTLFGVIGTSGSMASATGLFDMSAGGWATQWERLLPEGTLPKLGPILDDKSALRLLPRWHHWEAYRDSEWFIAVGDGACSNVGAAGFVEDSFVVSVGTSSAVRVLRRSGGTGSPVPSELWNYTLDANWHLTGGALSEGGNIMAWIHRTFRVSSLKAVENAILQRSPDAGYLTILPFIAGERSPNWNPQARAVMEGFSNATTAMDVLQASIEAVSYRIKLTFDRLAEWHGPPAYVICAGAALRASPLWVQILADVLDRPVMNLQFSQASSRGAAAIALQRSGITRIDDLDHPRWQEVAPRPVDRSIYEAAMARQVALYRRAFAAQ